MLICEVLNEDQGDILNALEEILTRAKANMKTKVPTNMVLAKLRAMGYSIDITSLIDMLATITIVGSANKKDITLHTALPRSDADPEDQTVSKMAQKQIDKDIYLITTFAVFLHLNYIYTKKVLKILNNSINKDSILIFNEPIAKSRYERFNLHYPRSKKFWIKNLKHFEVNFYNDNLIVARKIV